MINKKINDFSAPSHDEVKQKITKKIGERPQRPDDFQVGEWTSQALKVLKERYLLKNEKLETIEMPEDMLWRVSWEIASAEVIWGGTKKDVFKKAKEFYDLMLSKKFLPNSPTLMNAGTNNGLQYSACFVLPVEDSMEGIFDALKHQAIIHKTGGGTGFSFTRLRPSGSLVRTSSGTASGPISFMRIFDAATNEVKQGGKRRGANMGILRVDHPDIMEFIHCKDRGGITNFNISVAITNEFMRAYKNNDYYNLVSPKDGKITGRLLAKDVFDEIAESAHKTGDPGLIFIDKINNSTANPVPTIGEIEATNPCGEQPLYPFDACNLGSIFLGYFVKDGKIDWEDLKNTTRLGVRFLDNVIEVNPYPLKEIRNTVFAIRRIGLGVGGWADMLLSLGIAYDSSEAISLAEKVMKTIQDEAVSETQNLAKERGAFPMFKNSIYKKEKPRRNSTVTTIAPTGTISIIAGSSSGIEPLFAVAFRHVVKDESLERQLNFINPQFEKIARDKGFWTKELMDKVATLGVIRNMEEIPEDVRRIFGTAHEIEPMWHIKMQSAFQKHTENAVSKTINLKNDIGVEDVKTAYIMSWEGGCKGITVFRDGCKDKQVLNIGVSENEKKEKEGSLILDPLRHRPYVVRGSTYKMQTPVGTAFVTINEDEIGEPLEVFINVGKAGSDVAAMAEALGRTISTTLKFRGETSAKEKAREIADQLSGIGGRRSVGFGPTKIRSLPDAVAGALSIHYDFGINGYHLSPQIFNGSVNYKNGHTNGHVKEGTGENKTTEYLQMEINKPGDICPSCGAGALVFEEGCSKCHVCGHSEC